MKKQSKNKVIKINEKNLPKRLKKIRKAIMSAETTIGSVHFEKRSNGELRKMAYRLHVRTPSIARIPKGKKEKYKTYIKDKENLQMTVLDVNKVVRDNLERKIGRGAWRTIPLELVKRIAVKGKIYVISG